MKHISDKLLTCNYYNFLNYSLFPAMLHLVQRKCSFYNENASSILLRIKRFNIFYSNLRKLRFQLPHPFKNIFVSVLPHTLKLKFPIPAKLDRKTHKKIRKRDYLLTRRANFSAAKVVKLAVLRPQCGS